MISRYRNLGSDLNEKNFLATDPPVWHEMSLIYGRTCTTDFGNPSPEVLDRTCSEISSSEVWPPSVFDGTCSEIPSNKCGRLLYMTTICDFTWCSTEIKVGISSDVKVPCFESIQGLPLLAPFLNLHSEDVKVLGSPLVAQYSKIASRGPLSYIWAYLLTMRRWKRHLGSTIFRDCSRGSFLNLHAEDVKVCGDPLVRHYTVIAYSASFFDLHF